MNNSILLGRCPTTVADLSTTTAYGGYIFIPWLTCDHTTYNLLTNMQLCVAMYGLLHQYASHIDF